MKTASRTLVMSPPEVWEQLDHPGRMQGLMAALLGRATEVDVYEREEESKLAWKADHGEGDAWIEVEIAEKGWGTNVSVTAENGSEPTKLEGWLDAVLDELATPQKRPFRDMTEEAPAETPPVESAPEEATPIEVAPVDEAPVKEAPVEADPVEPDATPEPEPPPKKRRRRFFRF
jgi:cell division septation protein DedD